LYFNCPQFDHLLFCLLCHINSVSCDTRSMGLPLEEISFNL
jgi:hypothetical protein